MFRSEIDYIRGFNCYAVALARTGQSVWSTRLCLIIFTHVLRQIMFENLSIIIGLRTQDILTKSIQDKEDLEKKCRLL